MGFTHWTRKVVSFVLLLSIACEAWPCETLSKTELESIFCQIKGQSPMLQSMSIQDFRKNPEQTQRLLLSRPAKKMGIALPKSAALQNTPPKTKIQNPTNSNQSRQNAKAALNTPQPVAKENSTGGMENCSFSVNIIVCGKLKFTRVFNRANRFLSEQALTDANRLTDDQFHAVKAQSESHYLRKFYEEYLMKMLSIGLSEHTLSYTKFVNLFRLSRQEGVDFASRMGKMFEYLKKDKASMQVKVGAGTAPESIEQCFKLSSNLIVCDNVQSNWVYLANG